MLYAKCICCMHAQPLARYRFSLHCEPVLRKTVPARRFKPCRANTVLRSPIVFTLPPIPCRTMPTRFHGVRLCLHYPLFHAVPCQHGSTESDCVYTTPYSMPYHANTVPRSPIVFTLPPIPCRTMPTRFHGVRLCLHYPYSMPYHANTVPWSPIVFTLPPIPCRTVPTRFHGVRLCLHYPYSMPYLPEPF